MGCPSADRKIEIYDAHESEPLFKAVSNQCENLDVNRHLIEPCRRMMMGAYRLRSSDREEFVRAFLSGKYYVLQDAQTKKFWSSVDDKYYSSEKRATPFPEPREKSGKWIKVEVEAKATA